MEKIVVDLYLTHIAKALRQLVVLGAATDDPAAAHAYMSAQFTQVAAEFFLNLSQGKEELLNKLCDMHLNDMKDIHKEMLPKMQEAKAEKQAATEAASGVLQ